MSHTTLNSLLSPENGFVKLDVIHGSLPARPSTAYVGRIYFPVAREGSSDCPVTVKQVERARRPSDGIVVGHKPARGASRKAESSKDKTAATSVCSSLHADTYRDLRNRHTPAHGEQAGIE